MKLLLPLALLALYAAGPQCETRPPEPDGGRDAGRKDSGSDAGLGDGGCWWCGGWDPNLPDGGYPGSGRNGDPGTDVVFVVRMDRGRANDASLYVRLVDQVRAALAHAGLTILETAVVSHEDGRPLWAQSKNTPPPVKLLDALNFYARQLPDPSEPCSITGLSQLGANMPYELLSYPPELTGVPWYEQPFLSRPGALLVVMIDSDLRPAPITSLSCATLQASPATYFAGNAFPQWLLWRLPRPTTRFWLVSTPEDGTSVDTMRGTCLASGLPPTMLDAIAPSTVPFYDPWASGMNAYFPDLATRADYCTTMMGALPANDLADAWAKVLRAQVGLP